MERPLGSGVSPVFLVNILHVFSKFLFCFLFGHFPTPKGQTKNFEKPHSIFRKKGLTNPTWGQHVAAGPWQCCMWGWGAETRGARLGSPPPHACSFPRPAASTGLQCTQHGGTLSPSGTGACRAEPDSPFPSPGQQQLTVQNVSGNNLTISGLSPTQIQLQMEQALSGEMQPGEKRRRMACTCPNCKDGEKR